MYDETDILTPQIALEDKDLEVTLRPRYMNEYIGQERVKQNMLIFIEAAKSRNEALDHVLLSGPPGLGKTTLANIIANEMGVSIKITSGPALERAGDLAAILTNLAQGDILFIDEIHRLNRAVEEILYPAMEDFEIDLVIGKGPGARSIRLSVPPFTLIGATTRTGLITSPLRDRFGVQGRLDYYDEQELRKIVERSAVILGIEVTATGADEIAMRSRGTPRIANRLLKRVRDFAQVIGDGIIDDDISIQALKQFEVDEKGLDKLDHRILKTLIEKFKGAPVGLNTIAVAIGEEPETIEDVYEPYLLQLGFIQRTPRGRIVTALAYEHLNIDMPEQNAKLF